MKWTFWDYVKAALAATLCVTVIVAIKLAPMYLG